MTLGNFLKLYRENKNLSQRQFATICGVSNGYISLLEKGVNPKTQEPIMPNIATLKIIANAMGMSLNELFERVDDMPVDLTNEFKSTDYPYSISNIIPLPETKQVPLLGTIACGEPILANENIEDYVSMPVFINATFALRCKGNSMIGARINDGDIVYIRKQETVENGEIAAVLIDNEATLKRFYKYGDTVVLRAENPDFSELTYKNEEINTIRVLGKAVYFLSTIK